MCFSCFVVNMLTVKMSPPNWLGLKNKIEMFSISLFWGFGLSSACNWLLQSYSHEYENPSSILLWLKVFTGLISRYIGYWSKVEFNWSALSLLFFNRGQSRPLNVSFLPFQSIFCINFFKWGHSRPIFPS